MFLSHTSSSQTLVGVLSVALTFTFSSRGVMLPPAGQPAEDTWRLNYVTGNLFSCPEDQALAHCISEDCRMGAGIAVMFKQKFKGLEELKNQSESDFLLKTSTVEGEKMSHCFPGNYFVQLRETALCSRPQIYC